MDTVFALASARGKAGVAVIRISGPRAWAAIGKLCSSLPAPRQAALRKLVDPEGNPLDQALVLLFEQGASFTGEESGELHLHGSNAVVQAVLRVLSGIDGLRLAEPGEFTRRALENECLDLAQVEGLSDLIESETEAQRRQAFRILSGSLGEQAEIWRSDLIRAAALLEATIDFADEDVPVDVSPEVTELISKTLETLKKEVKGARVAERVRNGFEIAIVGPPNVGKSTLLNTLAGRDAAITSEIAGTTRDVIEVQMDLTGIPVTVLDTAGIRDTSDKIEKIGVDRAKQRAESADIRVFLIENQEVNGFQEPKDDDIVLLAKSDLHDKETLPRISGKTGEGIDWLVAQLIEKLERRVGLVETATHERHRLAIERSILSLESACDEVSRGAERSELAAEEIRDAIRALDSLVGRIDIEHILDEIFASFCLGK